MKLRLGDMDEVYGTVADGGKHGALIIEDNKEGNVRALLRGCRRYPVDGAVRRLSNHDLLRTLPVRIRGWVWSEMLDYTERDRQEVNAWYGRAIGDPDAVMTLPWRGVDASGGSTAEEKRDERKAGTETTQQQPPHA